MMVMTAKVNPKKIILVLAAIAAAILAVIWLWPGESDAQTPTAKVATNDDRVAFLTNLGWDVTVTPTETMQVRIPETGEEVFQRYNNLQKSQGYDLSAYGGKTVMRYVYQVNNYPGATDPVYATLLIYKDQVIGGDVTNTSPGGSVRSLQRPSDI